MPSVPLFGHSLNVHDLVDTACCSIDLRSVLVLFVPLQALGEYGQNFFDLVKVVRQSMERIRKCTEVLVIFGNRDFPRLKTCQHCLRLARVDLERLLSATQTMNHGITTGR